MVSSPSQRNTCPCEAQAPSALSYTVQCPVAYPIRAMIYSATAVIDTDGQSQKPKGNGPVGAAFDRLSLHVRLSHHSHYEPQRAPWLLDCAGLHPLQSCSDGRCIYIEPPRAPAAPMKPNIVQSRSGAACCPSSAPSSRASARPKLNARVRLCLRPCFQRGHADRCSCDWT